MRSLEFARLDNLFFFSTDGEAALSTNKQLLEIQKVLQIVCRSKDYCLPWTNQVFVVSFLAEAEVRLYLALSQGEE